MKDYKVSAISPAAIAGTVPDFHLDPEVVAQAKRRRFMADYERRILAETDHAKRGGSNTRPMT